MSLKDQEVCFHWSMLLFICAEIKFCSFISFFLMWKLLLIVMVGHPGEASLWIISNIDGLVWKRLPLHVICRHQPTTDAAEALIDAFPESPAYRDNLKWLPLHYACKFGAAIDVVNLLIEAVPNAVFAKNRDGDTPLDLIKRDNNRDAREKHSIMQLLVSVMDSDAYAED